MSFAMEKENHQGLGPKQNGGPGPIPAIECLPLTKSVSGTSTQTINYDMINNRVGPSQIHVKSHTQPFKHQKTQQQKYTKIQPAIAPKPVMPKPSTFSPIVTSKTKSVHMQLSCSDSVINTSKRWVLPPRPRPGRKPTSDEIKAKQAAKLASPIIKTEPGIIKSPEELAKGPSTKRAKVCKKEQDAKFPMLPIPTDSTTMRKAKSEAVRENQMLDTAKVPIPEPSFPSLKFADSKSEISNLKVSYLAKLKEQELIRNYIEVLSNQIKELSFVQNGVITFDALRNTPSLASNVKIKKANGNSFANMPGANANPPVPAKPSSYDQLESINNLNDLNKFLGYLTRSSNLIHSVTKKKKSTDKDEALNNQINYYVDIRSKFKTMQSNEMKKVNSLKKLQSTRRSIKNEGELSINGPSSILASPKDISDPSSLSSTPGPAPTDSPQRQSSSKFTPDLLKPLHTSNLFDQDMDDGIVLDLIGEEYTSNMDGDDVLMDERDFVGMMRGEDESSMNNGIDGILGVTGMFEDEEENLGAVKIHDKKQEVTPVRNHRMNESLLKKKLKLNCGFCTNDTPCLCLDAEIDLSRLI
jgi:hypothetical protein